MHLNTIYQSIRRNPLIIGVLVLCTGAFMAFLNVADEVLEGDSHSIDTKLLLMLRDPHDAQNPLGPRWLEEMMRDITGLGGIAVLTLVTVFTVIYFIVTKKKGEALYLTGCVVTGIALSNILKVGFNIPRPDLVPHGSITYMAGFPSGHSMMSAIVYLTLGALIAEIQPNYRLKSYVLFLAVLITLLVGVSRVYLGVHWPSDVLAGWLGGAAWAALAWLVQHSVKLRFLRNP